MLSRGKLVLIVVLTIVIAFVSFLIGISLNGSERWLQSLITAVLTTGLAFAWGMYLLRSQSKGPR
jgi:hypothetical protein